MPSGYIGIFAGFCFVCCVATVLFIDASFIKDTEDGRLNVPRDADGVLPENVTGPPAERNRTEPSREYPHSSSEIGANSTMAVVESSRLFRPLVKLRSSLPPVSRPFQIDPMPISTYRFAVHVGHREGIPALLLAAAAPLLKRHAPPLR